MLPESTEQFFIDDMGYLWAGPYFTVTGTSYKRFEGCTPNKGRQVWRWLEELGSSALPPMEKITQAKALEIIRWHRADAIQR